MSSDHSEPSTHAHSTAHDEADHEAEDTLDPDEPHTPNWLPMLGGALFLLAGILAVASNEGTADTAQATPAQALVAPKAPAAQPAQPSGDAPAPLPGGQDSARQILEKLGLGNGKLPLPPAPAPDPHAGHGH